MTRTTIHSARRAAIVRSSAFAALALLASSLLAEDASALTRLGAASQFGADTPQGAGSGAAPRVILAGGKRSQSLYRSRSVGRSQVFRSTRHYPLGSRHLKRSQRFQFKGAQRLNVPRQFRGRRDFSSTVNTRVLGRNRTLQNPNIINSRSLPLLRGRELTDRTLIRTQPNWFGRSTVDVSGVRVLRGDALMPDSQARLMDPGQTTVQETANPAMPPARTLTEEAQSEAAEEEVAEAPDTGYGFSAY